MRGKESDSWASFWFLLPVLAVFIVLFAVPLFQTFYFSLTDFTGYSTEVNFVGLKNYIAVFTDSALLEGLFFTLIYTVATTVVVTLLAIPLAIQLDRKFFGRDFVRSLFFFLSVPSMAILGLIWQFILLPLDSGALNSILTELLGADSVGWLAGSTSARICVIAVAIWAQVGWHATLYLAFLQSIPKDIYEQADIDGANAWNKFVHITLPQLMPGIVVSTFLLVSSGLKVYDLPFTLTKGGPGYATNTITQSIIIRGISQGRADVGSALAVLFTIAVGVIVMFQLKISRVVERRFS